MFGKKIPGKEREKYMEKRKFYEKPGQRKKNAWKKEVS